MNKEDLFIGIGNLDEDLLRRSEQGGRNIDKKRNISKIVKYGSVAACFVVALVLGGLFWNDGITNDDEVPEDNIVAENNGEESVIQNNMQGEVEEYINVSTLLASDEGMEEETLLHFSNIAVDKYAAAYFKVSSVESDVLGKSIGGEIEGARNWYKISGHDDLFYLIAYDNTEYSLWKFGYFEEAGYPYSDVLRLIYNIDSAKDIKEIVVEPATMDHTDQGKALQNEIGTANITDAENIKTIYNILSGLTCYGNDKWDMIELGNDTPSSMLERVRAGRYLTFVTTDGMEIDTIKYTGISGMFYEFGGVAYNKLSKEQKDAMEEILNIDSSISKQQVNESEGKTEIQDAPVDESTDQVARDYSAELTDLQNRITQAMINKELPFVTSCGIYEKPDRVMAVVNTEDEDLLAKLRAFDTTGDLLEIVYSREANDLE